MTIKPLQLTRFWHRRICEAAMLVAGIILVLYFWVFFIGVENVSTVLMVDDYAAIAAGVTFAVALVSYLWSPRVMLMRTAFLSYVLLMLMTVLLLANTGYLFSPFIALWMLVALFGPIFGGLGILFTLAIMIGFLAWLGLNDNLTIDQLVTSLFITITPLIVGLLAWQSNREEEPEDRSYNELARELRSVAGKSDVVIAAIADGVIALDKAGTIELINPAAQKLIGWGKSDAVGLDYKSVLRMTDSHDKPVEPANDPVRKVLDTNQAASADSFSLETAESGKKILAHITASPIGSAGSGVIVVFRDTTNEKAEEREQAEFISTASHEMRTPVASIEGYLGLALNPNTAQVDDKAREYISKAQDAAQHLGRLFQDLLDVSRADDGRLSNNPKVVDLVPFVLDIVRGLAPKAYQKGLQVNYIPVPSLDLDSSNAEDKGERTLQPVFYVNVDNDHLREVVANLVENAIKYTLTGTITINVTGDENHTTISISDSGIGIPKEDLSHLFQKFYRVDNTETREIGGTGLGLYLSRKLTESMGGRIWAESEYQQGSTFFVQLPRLDHVEAKQLIEKSHQSATPAPLPVISAVKAAPEPTPSPAPAPIQTPQVQVQQPTGPISSIPSANLSPAPLSSTPPVENIADPYARPSIEAMSPQPVRTDLPPVSPASVHARTAPVFIPGQNRPNTPLSTIESNPRQFIEDAAKAAEHQKPEPTI